MSLKAIETTYKGYRFRSRLEARWAVFFDTLELSWEYEPEGFETSAGWYLPDFRLVRPMGLVNVIWVEVKPVHSEQVTDPRFFAFQKGLPPMEDLHVVVGDPLNVVEMAFGPEATPKWEKLREVLMAAAVVARSARFEHGETPR